ncbi:hypothetical protein SDC9_106766 [bioreactor metagenome]|uniref:Uncharacterized protein n=1 Tax=bioreactor metagenome TaxID=1076179 RepID=A0A645B381_9ZZZZ
MRQVVVGTRVAGGACGRVRGGDCQGAVDGRNIVLIRHVRCAAHDLHRAERHAGRVGSGVRAAAGDGIPRHRHAGNIHRSRRHAARGAVVNIACAVRRDHKRLVLRIVRIDRRVCGQVVRRRGAVGAKPIVLRPADRTILRRGNVICRVARAVCHPFGADHGTVRAGAIRHLRVDRQAAVDPRNGIALRDIHATALEHKPRLIGKARRVHAGVRAAGTRRRVLNRESRHAGRDAGDASRAAVIVLRGAVRRQRQRRLRRPDRVERQVARGHGHARAGCICRVCRGCARRRVPTEEIITRAGERVCVHREACPHRLCRAVACVSAHHAPVAVVGECKERHAGVDHDGMIRRDAADSIGVARIGGGGQRRAVIRHAGDFISRRKRPCDGRVRAVYISTRAGFGRNARGGICRYAHPERLVFPNGIECARCAYNTGSEQNAVTGIIHRPAAV